jgi:NAD(P)-dependent dehydrogenase (short-subunit alcohol dehydrogenase family)
MSRILITGCSKGLGRATVIELARCHRQRSLRAELDNSSHIGDVQRFEGGRLALTNWLRTAVREQGTQVLGLHVGPVDTDMARELTLPKVKPVDVVR